ncbi:hypothetical protein ACIRBX_32540 [Kitasatospora sp. NPDC096147]|uniref:hypothetical protein n=1 Tax=Kitasatospora sp. NPDC096147 TaxID=3364093 RepID=UPI003816C1A3
MSGFEGAPTDARLREVLGRAGRVEIIEAPPGEADDPGHLRTVLTGAGIAELGGLLAVADGGTGDRCRCQGWPTVRVHDEAGELIAELVLHHQRSLRGLGDTDAALLDGPALSAWLAGRGLTGSREVERAREAGDAEDERRIRRWLAAAPPGLAEAAVDVARPPGASGSDWSAGLSEARERLRALTRERYPAPAERIPLLLAWAGAPAREATGGLRWFDIAVEDQLLAEDPALVLAALADRPTPAQLDGASELFANLEWSKANGTGLPGPVHRHLAAHIEADGTDTMRWRLANDVYGEPQPEHSGS